MGLVIFDLDGTLADTLLDIHGTVEDMLRDAGRPTLTLPQLRGFVGAGARELLRLTWAATGVPADAALEQALAADFLARYQERCTDRTVLFPGALDALDALSHHTLAVATNKAIAPTERILGALGIRGRFAAVVGGDTLPVKKPNPAIIARVRADAGVDGPAVLIGDSATDVNTARNAGIPVVFVTWGYPGPDGAPPPPDATIERFSELPGVLSRWL